MAFPITSGTGTTIAADVYGTAHDVSSAEQVQLVGIATGTLGALALATPVNPIPVRTGVLDTVSVTLTLDTSAYSASDLLAEVQTVAGAARVSGGLGELVSMTVVDEDDQGVALTVFLTSVNTTWGSENSAPTLSDTAARSIQAVIPVGTGDYVDVGGAKIAQIKNIGAVYETSGSADLYVAVVNGAGTPTFSASGVKLIFGFKQN